MGLFDFTKKKEIQNQSSSDYEQNTTTVKNATAESNEISLFDNQSPFVCSGNVLTKYTDKEFCGEVCVPPFVIKIADQAFMGCKLSSVIIPGNCTYIGERAFSLCTNLQKVEFLHSKKMFFIDDFAFSGCEALSEICLPTCYHTGCNCFEYCLNLTKVKFDNKNRTVGKAMFKECVSLVDVVLPEDLFSIQEEAFFGCTSLCSISLPDNLEKFFKNPFENCTSLTQIRIPSKVKCIPSRAFSGCRMLQSVEISYGVSIIENDAFKDCNIKNVVLPPSVFNLGEHAFDSNTIVSGYQKRKIIFPNAPEDIIGFPTIGERIKPIYYTLFSIDPAPGYDYASAAINLMTGNLHRIDSKQVSYGVVLSSENNVSGLSFDCLPLIGRHTLYKDMTQENWKEYIPHEELEKAKKNTLRKREIDNSFTANDEIKIDGLYIKLRQRFGVTAFYFRKTQTGYRLYSAQKSGSHTFLLSFDENKCSETFLYDVFISSGSGCFTLADEQRDIAVNRNEFLTIINSAPDIFSGKYIGKKKSVNTPISIYGDDIFDAVLWKNNKEIPCADHPEIEKIYDALREIK